MDLKVVSHFWRSAMAVIYLCPGNRDCKKSISDYCRSDGDVDWIFRHYGRTLPCPGHHVQPEVHAVISANDLDVGRIYIPVVLDDAIQARFLGTKPVVGQFYRAYNSIFSGNAEVLRLPVGHTARMVVSLTSYYKPLREVVLLSETEATLVEQAEKKLNDSEDLRYSRIVPRRKQYAPEKKYVFKNAANAKKTK